MRTSNPSVSVVLPAYNAAEYIKSAVVSILNQTYKDIELIVINDGSTDETLQILLGLQKLDSRLLIISRENRGLVRSLNEGMAAARGAWIARMDADDISKPNRIQKQITYAEEQKLDICGAYVRTFGFCRPNIRKYPVTSAGANLQLAFNTCFAHPTIIGRAEVLKENPYSERFDKIEDYELWTRLAVKGFRLGNVPEVLLHYRRTFSQATSVHRSIQDEMRIAIAMNYVKYTATMLPSDVLLALLSRSSRIDDDTVTRAAYKLHELIVAGHDIEDVLAHNLKLFLMHNCTTLGSESWGYLKALLPARSLLSIGAMRGAGFHPGHKLWNFLYLLK
jgi:glycosyltransferase involved in cell wall biosynthesis